MKISEDGFYIPHPSYTDNAQVRVGLNQSDQIQQDAKNGLKSCIYAAGIKPLSSPKRAFTTGKRDWHSPSTPPSPQRCSKCTALTPGW